MKKVYLFEDHDRSLSIWRQNKIKGLDLVHVDAHIDFGFHEAEPIDDILDHARSVAELKRKLEYSQAYRRFEKDFSKQLDIGNYIYPAMREGIVKDFYWVVPGCRKEFLASRKVLIATLKQLIRVEGSKARIESPQRDSLKTEIFGRKLYVCTLDSLPAQKKPVCLDIDIDFMVINSADSANNTAKIGKRRPWIIPEALASALQKKVAEPSIVTIAYSCNGGYTPMKYRYLGDELACLLGPFGAGRMYKRNREASRSFVSFLATGKKKYYSQAVRLNPIYRAPDNNYGPLYLSVNNYRLAHREFMKIVKVDPHNPGSLAGLGALALKKKDFSRAKTFFLHVLRSTHSPLFKGARADSLIGLAQAEYRLAHLAQARNLLLRYKKQRPLDPFCRYLLGRIAQKQEDYALACSYYTEAVRLGFGGSGILYRLAKISFSCKEKGSIIKLVKKRLAQLKKVQGGHFTKKEKKLIVLVQRFLR